MLERNGVEPGSWLLELGAGNARVAIPLARLGYRVTGVEYSKLFVENGLRRIEEAGLEDMVELIHGDVYQLDKLLEGKVFDAVYTTWTTIIGYGLFKDCDELVLRKAWGVVRPGGLLVIANTASYDRIGLRQGLYGSGITFLSKVSDEFMTFEQPRFDPVESILVNRWVFYRREGMDLRYLGEVEFRIRIYTLHELVELARRAGWELVEAVDDPLRATPYRSCRSSFNLVFRRVG
ncbi:hypothetical protein Pyrde_0215 [Pyrodictium delaneyi]|uniref:SAM-dependent methyltransferase n=1 Tax=Pyrodictium delaneyi TaxID=1273541 RepID=A0A0N7JCT2_9CREN|nr:class I SAM-dependent methyltransferase [Pyrodictium delaneyi]ALL00265.1 hypothetical protein Pyrde_0215 [Pyrodictium delaneyi]OWJ54343.1 SAM-dependent methyltransferase [Pyrodictium delaneyi]